MSLFADLVGSVECLQIYDSLAGLRFRFWCKASEGLCIRLVRAELDGVHARGIDARMEAAGLSANRVEDFAGGVLDDLYDGVGSIFKYEFGQPAGYFATVVIFHRDGYTPLADDDAARQKTSELSFRNRWRVRFMKEYSLPWWIAVC